MAQIFLTPVHKQAPPNCVITAVEVGNDLYHLEIWDVTGDYHSMKPLQKNIPEKSDWHKYKNKRYQMSSKELFETYRVLPK